MPDGIFLLFVNSASRKLEAPKRNSGISMLLLDGKIGEEKPKLRTVCIKGLEEQDPSTLLCS